MDLLEIIEEYKNRFGGYPAFLLMGASDNEIKKALTKCLEEGKELEAPENICF